MAKGEKVEYQPAVYNPEGGYIKTSGPKPPPRGDYRLVPKIATLGIAPEDWSKAPWLRREQISHIVTQDPPTIKSRSPQETKCQRKFLSPRRSILYSY